MSKKIVTTQYITNWVKTLFTEQLANVPVWLKDINLPTVDTVFYEEQEVAVKKNLCELLNIEWYDGHKILTPARDWVESMRASLKRSFASVEVSSEDIEFSPDIDYKVISADIEFLTSTNHIQHLDYAVQLIKNAFMGQAVTKIIDGSEYTIFLNFGALVSGDVIVTAVSSESILSNVSVEISIMQAIATYSDYSVSLSFDGGITYLTTPLNKFAVSKQMSPKPVPYYMKDPVKNDYNAQHTATHNTNAATSWSLSWWDINRALTKKVNVFLLDDFADINSKILLKINYSNQDFIYPVVFQGVNKTITNGAYVGTEVSFSRATR